MIVFPDILMRIGGMPFETLAAFRIGKWAVAAEKVIQTSHQWQEVRTAFSNACYQAIPLFNGLPVQKQLLNLRRDIFNGRKPDRVLFDNIIAAAPELAVLLEQYVVLYQQYEADKQVAETVFREELRMAREYLAESTHHPAFEQGVLLSSRVFFGELPVYRQRFSGEESRKILQAEHTALRYLTRIAGKTSPFGSFNQLGLARVVPHAAWPLQAEGVKTMHSHVRLNNQLFLNITGLLYSHRKWRRQIPLRLNPTISKTDEQQFLFLVNDKNVESFQRLNGDELLELVIHEMSSAENPDISLLAERLLETVDADKADIESYIIELIEIGLLEFRLDISGTDPDWDMALIKALEKHFPGEPLLVKLVAVLRNAKQNAGVFEKSPAKERAAILSAVYAEIRSTYMELHEAAGLPEAERQLPGTSQKTAEQDLPSKSEGQDINQTFSKKHNTYFWFGEEHLFYEDTFDEQVALLPADSMFSVGKAIENCARLFHRFEYNRPESERMHLFFQQHYAPSEQVSLMRFYEDYYKHVRFPEQQADENGTPVETPGGFMKPKDRYEKLIEEWSRIVAPLIERQHPDQAEEIRYSSAELEPLLRENGLYEERKNASTGAFLQFFERDGKMNAVVNALQAGYGKYYSRFLHVLPVAITEGLRKFNRAEVLSGQLFIEATDASCFNANLHPPLLDAEISLPGGNNSLPKSMQVPVTDIVVCSDKKRLHLVHTITGKKIEVLDLSFENLSRRSRLYQLVVLLSVQESPANYHLSKVVNDYCYKKAVKGKVIAFPRVVFDDHLVVQRRRWEVPSGNIPCRLPSETEADYGLRLRIWIKENNWPAQVFINIAQHEERIGGRNEKLSVYSSDDYKPQYMDFDSPLFIRFFDRLSRKTGRMIRITEMLPGPKDLLQSKDGHYITEYVCNWFNENEHTL